MPNIPTVKRRGRPPGARTRLPVTHHDPSIEPLAVRVDRAAVMLDCGVSKVKMLIADGTLESVKVGSMRLVKVASLRRLVGV